MEIDADARLLTATGRVRITDGQIVATAAQARLFSREGRVALTGHAKVVGPQGTLEGDEITLTYKTRAITGIVGRGNARLALKTGALTATTVALDPAADTVAAEERVTFTTAPGVVARGRRMTYQRARGLAVIEGEARLQNRDGFIQGDRIEGSERFERAVVTGSVFGSFRDIEVRSQSAELFGAERKAVFVGDVELKQTGRWMSTEKVTVWYGDGRLVAEGYTRVRIEPPP